MTRQWRDVPCETLARALTTVLIASPKLRVSFTHESMDLLSSMEARIDPDSLPETIQADLRAAGFRWHGPLASWLLMYRADR